jgi:Glycoside-hydrolase family GH114
VPDRHRILAGAVALLAAAAAPAPAHAAQAPAVGAPVAHGTLRISGHLRDGGTVAAEGVRWHPSRLPAGDRLLSFVVAYTWSACAAPAGPCRPGADTTAAPFAAARYTIGHGDVGRFLRVTETATETVETDAATFTFRETHSSRTRVSARPVRTYRRGRAPTTALVNGTPERRTGSDREKFEVAAPHFNAADGAPTVRYRVDGHPWLPLPPARVISTGTLAPGVHRLRVEVSNRAGATATGFTWRVVPLPAPRPCTAAPGRSCWYPPHLDRTGRPMRWDWQIGRVAPLERTGVHAVDIYDIDGFLTTPAEVRAIHTRWQAATLPHPRAICYIDLAWEIYRPDATPGRGFPARTLGSVYYGYPDERWVDLRQLHALKPMLDRRIRMCAAKGFDAVEFDDIDSYDPPSETGFHLTPGDLQNFLAVADNDVHRHGMTVLWKNSPLLAWWGRSYADGAVVEECYVYHQCFSASLAGTSAYGITCTRLGGAMPCGWDAFTADRTAAQPTGKWVGEDEYRQDGYVCDPGQPCAGPRRFSAYCSAVWGRADGFSAIKLSDNLDGAVFLPCPAGR